MSFEALNLKLLDRNGRQVPDYLQATVVRAFERAATLPDANIEDLVKGANSRSPRDCRRPSCKTREIRLLGIGAHRLAKPKAIHLQFGDRIVVSGPSRIFGSSGRAAVRYPRGHRNSTPS